MASVTLLMGSLLGGVLGFAWALICGCSVFAIFGTFCLGTILGGFLVFGLIVAHYLITSPFSSAESATPIDRHAHGN